MRLLYCMQKRPIGKYDLEKRLIDFSVLIIDLAENLNSSRAGNHLSGQLLRSGTSPALNYGEAQSSESKRDFVHKLKIVLKELRESYVCLQIIKRTKLSDSEEKLEAAMKEVNELISIFVKSIDTARKNIS